MAGMVAAVVGFGLAVGTVAVAERCCSRSVSTKLDVSDHCESLRIHSQYVGRGSSSSMIPSGS
jgi:hypothetical protein